MPSHLRASAGQGFRRCVMAVTTVLATVIAATAAVPAVSHAQGAPQHIGIPAYFDPNGAGAAYWTQLEQNAGQGTVATANPSNGPGASFDQGYADTIAAATKAGIRVIGYVDTGYFGSTGRTTRNGQTSASAWTAQAESDVANWFDWYGSYGLTGIFFDDAEATCGVNNANVALYSALNVYTKQHNANALTVDNPGGPADQCFTSAADALVMFEGSYQDYLNWTAPAWERNSTNPNKFWNLVYDTPTQADMKNAATHSQSENAGYIYITDDVLPNPWDTLPAGSYWADELSSVGVLGGGCTTIAGSGDITNYSVCVSNGNAVFQATFNVQASFYHVFIDSDENSTTGYQLPSNNPLGADYMIENNALYISTCSCWMWNEITGVNPTMAVSANTYRWTIPLSAIDASAPSARAVFNAGTSYSTPITFATN